MTKHVVIREAIGIGSTVKQPGLGNWHDGIVVAMPAGPYVHLVDKYGSKTMVAKSRLLVKSNVGWVAF